MSDSNDSIHMTLIEHLTELRSRLVKAAYACVAGMLICYNFSDVIFNWVRAPIAKYLPMGGLVFTAPADKFIAHIKISFFGGLILSCPFWLYQVWKFIAPGLYSREKKYSLAFILSGASLFGLGIVFAYYVVFPMAFHFLMGYGGDIDKPMITIDMYLSFFVTTTLMFGLAFEMPLAIVILVAMGIVSSRFLRDKRRYAVVVMAIISGIITPPDLLSMLMMLVPMVLLYEISVWIVYFLEKKQAKESLQYE